MEKENIKIMESLKSFFNEKGYEKEYTEYLEQVIEEKPTKQKRKLYKTRKINDLKDMIEQSNKLFTDKPAFKYKNKDGEINSIKFGAFYNQINGLGTKLIDMGLKGKKIAVISENRYEWCVAYLATVCGTGVIVPLDRALPANELETLIIRAGVEAIFYSSKFDDVMKDIKQRRITDLRYFISMDLDKMQDGIYSQYECIEKGNELIKNGDRRFLDAKINNEEMSFLLFTSGTTSTSKAVMLSHKNICSNMMDIGRVLYTDERDIMLSMLPLHHTFECTVDFLYLMYRGACIAYCDGIRHIAKNIKEYQITEIISVPALFENMYKRVMKEVEKKGKLQEVEKIMKVSGILSKVGIDFRKKIFKEIHESFGGKLRIMMNGAAALDPKVEKGFNNLGFKVCQGYGLTEASPIIAAGTDFDHKIGSVGKIFPSVKVKIIDKDEDGIGEIVVKGPNVMLGYYQNEEATKEVLDSKGWLRTGDLGYIDKKGFLFLSGRKKSVIVLKNGKNVFPEELENVINRIDGVKESFVFGKPEENDKDDLKICVKVVYDAEMMKEFYNVEEEKDIEEKLWEKIKEINKTMPPYKYIKELIITNEEFIKTTTGKIKRYEEEKKIKKDVKTD